MQPKVFTLYAIEADGVGKSFGKLHVLHDISFRLGAGDTLVLLGPNGAGKSTLLKILAGLYKPTSGSVRLLGQRFGPNPSLVRRKISFLGENYSLYDDLTVRENIMFFGRLYDIGDEEIRKRMSQWLRAFGAMQYIDRKVGELSRGTKQKAALCRALVNEPRILLLDEPSAFLDPLASRELHECLKTLSKKGVSIVYATQRLDELYKIGSSILLLRHGRNIALGSPNKIMDRLRKVEIEIVLARPMRSISRFAKWKARYGDSDRHLILSPGRVSEIPKAVKSVVDGRGEIISVLYMKESIDRILEGSE